MRWRTIAGRDTRPRDIIMSNQAERIRALNDALRAHGAGGEIVATRGLLALGADRAAAVFAAVQSFDAFTPENDPYGEHDFGLLTVRDVRVMFKIDYYNLTLSGHSPDPADARCTRRVMTIMLADEY